MVFHRLVTPEEALRRIEGELGGINPLGTEYIDIKDGLSRVLAEDIRANIDSPPFDRSEVDGYAVFSRDVRGADEDKPIKLKVVGKAIVGRLPETSVSRGEAVEIDTGAPLPRGADSVVMVEYTRADDGWVEIFRSVAPGENISHTGSDVSIGDVVLRKGTMLSPREIGVLAALGISKIKVYKKPRVAVFSTGNEIVDVGGRLGPGQIYDVNRYSLYSMIVESGGAPELMEILPDEFDVMRERILDALEEYDMVVSSGSTSAGLGDVMYRVISSIGGKILVHGLRTKPGKPTVIGVYKGKLVFGLPGFPVSAMIAFHLIARPVISKMAGIRMEEAVVRATLPIKIMGAKGRRRYLPVSLVDAGETLKAYPIFGSSGAISTLVVADGYIVVPENTQFLDKGSEVEVKLFSTRIRFPRLTIIGSHCPGVDLIIGEAGIRDVRIINVGSMGGWLAVSRGEADIAGTHILDERTGEYNVHMIRELGLEGKVVLVRGYGRLQGFIVQKGNPKNIKGFEDLLRDDVRIVNRVRGSGTRTLLDSSLKKISKKVGLNFDELAGRINGYSYEVKTHSAVAAAVAQGRADVGIGIKFFADKYNLDFIPIGMEIYDFAVRVDRMEKPEVKRFIETLRKAKESLERLPGFKALEATGKIIGSDG